MTRLTEDKVQKYLNADGSRCPFCGSDNIEGGEFEFDGVWREVFCLDCHEYWKDIYQLVGIYYDGKDIIPKGDE